MGFIAMNWGLFTKRTDKQFNFDKKLDKKGDYDD